jgi:zinc transporter ZupT
MAEEDDGIPLWFQALGFGLFSAVSLPLGAILGIQMAPVSDKVSARWMAFGSGALVFAVATQLYGAALFRLLYAARQDEEKHVDCGQVCQERFRNVNLQNAMGVVGALLYVLLNRLLERLATPKPVEPDNHILDTGAVVDDPIPADVAIDDCPVAIARVTSDGVLGSRLLAVSARSRTTSEVPVTQVMSSPMCALAAFRRANRSLSSLDQTREQDERFMSMEGYITRRRNSTDLMESRRSVSARELPNAPDDIFGLVPTSAPSSPVFSRARMGDAAGKAGAAGTAGTAGTAGLRLPMPTVPSSVQIFVEEEEQSTQSQSQSQSQTQSQTVTQSQTPSGADDEPLLITGNVALSMWLGLLLDGIPESLMLGFMTNERAITFEFLIAIFIANFPEAFSGSSLLRSQGMSVFKIFGMWFIVFMVTGLLSMVGSLLMPQHVEPGSSLEQVRDSSTAAFEGLTGGAMLAMISTAMLPEAFKGAGSSAGVLFVIGFVVSVFINELGARYGGPQEQVLGLATNWTEHFLW